MAESRVAPGPAESEYGKEVRASVILKSAQHCHPAACAKKQAEQERGDGRGLHPTTPIPARRQPPCIIKFHENYGIMML
ncbi:hypothetical protein E2C01_027200 [Portunus trituberculatus]|uniref:Uncharacterized protein n=1 Tax=Portunus trituberculatus TaxID=210409 RepID=A0A5B7EK82_PORTR|nr:hypothetical protein [Portunus trituberculatus]